MRAKALGWGTVLFFGPYQPNGVDRALGIARVRTKQELFERSDTLSLHCPLTKETRGVVGKELLTRMKKRIVLVNTSCVGVVDLDELEAALKSGKLAAAALDVIPVEPATERDGDGEEDVHPLIKSYRRGKEWLKGHLVVTPHARILLSRGQGGHSEVELRDYEGCVVGWTQDECYQNRGRVMRG